jgi:hypothetical protein
VKIWFLKEKYGYYKNVGSIIFKVYNDIIVVILARNKPTHQNRHMASEGITVRLYTNKCIAVQGQGTRAIKDQLKTEGFLYRPKLKEGGAGWTISSAAKNLGQVYELVKELTSKANIPSPHVSASTRDSLQSKREKEIIKPKRKEKKDKKEKKHKKEKKKEVDL